MKVWLESTNKVVSVNGVPARIWEGATELGIPIHAYVTRVAVADDRDTSEFERELLTCRPPSAEIDAIPTRLIL